MTPKSLLLTLCALVSAQLEAQQLATMPGYTLPDVPDIDDVASFDADGDGDIDVLTVSNAPSLMLNDGRGAFVTAPGPLPGGGVEAGQVTMTHSVVRWQRGD
ncbi:MAG: hypothetical protein AAF628_34570 [Planctomycetota bacterium]